jgi:hypothetical protein
MGDIMCIFCGGTCGGVGDALLPSASLCISLAILKIKAVRASHKQKLKEKASGKKETEPDSSVSQVMASRDV